MLRGRTRSESLRPFAIEPPRGFGIDSPGTPGEGNGPTHRGEHTAEHYEVVVIGAGQAGLAMGYFLARQKRRFLIVERAG